MAWLLWIKIHIYFRQEKYLRLNFVPCHDINILYKLPFKGCIPHRELGHPHSHFFLISGALENAFLMVVLGKISLPVYGTWVWERKAFHFPDSELGHIMTKTKRMCPPSVSVYWEETWAKGKRENSQGPISSQLHEVVNRDIF